MLAGQGQSLCGTPRGMSLCATHPKANTAGAAIRKARPAQQRRRLSGIQCRTAALELEAISAATPGSQDCLPAPAPGRLQNNATNFVEEHRIRAYEVGADQKATLITLANLLQVLRRELLLSAVMHNT